MHYLNAQLPIVDKNGVMTLSFLRFVQGLDPADARTFNLVPSSPWVGQTVGITDATTNAFGDVVVGGGALTVLAWWNGSDWTVIGQ